MDEKKYNLIIESDFQDKMKNEVEPYLDNLRKEKIFRYKDGQKIYCQYFLPEIEAKGSVFISHGFSECSEKFREMIYYFLEAGYGVVAIDHRGHGRSRFDNDKAPAYHATHVESFSDYIADMDMIVRHVLKKEMPKPYYLYAHSMGGCIGTLYLEMHPDVFSKAVLSSPMMELPGMKVPETCVKALGKLAKGLGQGKHLGPSQGLYDPNRDLDSSGAGSEARYTYYHEIQLANPIFQNSGASMSWGFGAYVAMDEMLKEKYTDKIHIPVLLFQAENDAFVWPGGQNKFISGITDGQLIFVPGAKHELYMEKDTIMDDYLEKIFEFLEK